MSGQPHDDHRSEQPDSELDPSQHVEEVDQENSENSEHQPEAEAGAELSGGISAPSGWELDDDTDATVDLPAVRIPSEAGDEPQDAEPSGDEIMEQMWAQLRARQVPTEPAEDSPATDDVTTDSAEDLTDIVEPNFDDLVAETILEPVVEPDAEETEDTDRTGEEAEVTATAVAAPSGNVNAEGLPLRPRERGRRSAKPAKKSRTLLWAVLAGILAVVIAVGLILFFALRNNDDKDNIGSTVDSMPTSIQKGSPAATVRDLGAAFKDGDAEAALDLLQIPSLQGSADQHPLLTNEVYSKAGNRPESITPAKESYGVPASNALTAGVSATISQGGEEQEISLRLTRADADSPWKVTTASLPALDVTDGAGAKVKANKVDVTLPGKADDYSTHRLFVLPGDYTLQRTNTKFVNYPTAKSFEASGLALASDPDAETTDLGSASLSGTLNDAFKKEADKSVDSWLNACIASKDIAPKNCPFGADDGGQTVNNIKWTLDKKPTKDYPDLSVTNATVEGKDGKASVEAKVKQNGEDATLEAEMDFQFTGTLSIKDNKVIFTYAG
ncbi:MAG: hypothetical protein ACTII7_08580 [Galactobacter sp.]